MKKIILTLLAAVCALGASADGDWRTTRDKVWDLGGDTGISGFLKKEAPAYITGNFEEKDRAEKPDFTKPLRHPSAYANRNGYWVISKLQAKAASTSVYL